MLSGFRFVVAAAIFAASVHAFAGGPGQINFFDGGTTEGNYTASPTRGATSQTLGQVRLIAVANNPVVTGITINLGGAARTGLSNLQLWHSGIPSLTGATQFGSTYATDPGASDMTFTGSASNFISNYYMLSGDLAADSTGTISPYVTAASLGGGDTFNSTFGGHDPMANSDPVDLPVTLSRIEVE